MWLGASDLYDPAAARRVVQALTFTQRSLLTGLHGQPHVDERALKEYIEVGGYIGPT